MQGHSSCSTQPSQCLPRQKKRETNLSCLTPSTSCSAKEEIFFRFKIKSETNLNSLLFAFYWCQVSGGYFPGGSNSKGINSTVKSNRLANRSLASCIDRRPMKDQGHMKSKMTLISTRGMGTETRKLWNLRKAVENGGRKLMPSYSLRQCLQSSTPCEALTVTKWSILSSQLKSHSTVQASTTSSLSKKFLATSCGIFSSATSRANFKKKMRQKKWGEKKEKQFSIQGTVIHVLSLFDVEWMFLYTFTGSDPR